MTQKEGAAPNRPPQEPQAAPAAVLPTVYTSFGQKSSPRLRSRAQVEEVLSRMWHTPVHTVLCRIGGGASVCYAHDGNGRWVDLDYRPALGYLVPADDSMADDYHDYLDTKFAAMRGVL